MRRILFAFLVMFVVGGCITSPLNTRENRIKSYLKNNPDTSAEVATAIRSESLVKGMDMEQVRLAWGEPGKSKSIPVGGGKKETIWYFYDKETKAGNLEDSSLFAMDVPAKRINFDRDGKVVDWKIYDEELETSRITALTKELPASVLAGRGQGKVIRAGEYHGWPYLILSTTMGKGDNAAAVLNGRIIGVGERTKGVKVLAVGTQGVKLEFGGQIGILKKGESTQ